MNVKRHAADLLFGVSVVCGVIFGGGQFVRMLTTAEGVSITWYAFEAVSFFLNLWLAVKAYRNAPSRVMLQTCAVYAIFVLLTASDIVAMVACRTGRWNAVDMATSLAVGFAVAAIFGVGWLKRCGLKDPIVRGALSMAFIGLPQFVLAYTIWTQGPAGLLGSSLLTGHITVCIRLGQLAFAIREASWERERIGAAMSDATNWISWLAVTAAWLAKTFR